MAEVIDALDKRIILELDTNSRRSDTLIAKKLRISKQLLKYRIKRLLQQGIAERFYTIINGVKLGYLYFRIYLKFQKLSHNSESELINSFMNNPYVTWVVSCRGTWDLVVSIYAKDTDHLSANYQSIVEKFQSNVLAKKIVVIKNVLFSTRKYLCDSEVHVDSIYGGVTENLETDKLDHKILHELSKNSRIKLVPLANTVDSSIDTVRLRIKRMEKLGIIKGHKLSLNFSKIGFLFFIVSVNLSNSSETARKKLENYCKSHSNSVYLVNLLGDHDIDLEVEVESQQQLDSFLRDLKNKFFDIIRDVEVIQVTEQHKLNYYPLI